MAKDSVRDIDAMLERKPAAPKPQAAERAADPVVTKLVKSQKRLTESRITLTGYLRNSWDITVERGTILSDILDPEYWAHVASKLRPHDTLHVICEDGSWYARLFVINADRLWAKLHVLEQHDLTVSQHDMPQTQEEAHEVTWLSSIAKYVVIRRSDRALLKYGFQTKLEAFQWLDGHLKTINN
jgi:hypothetical protein